MNRRQFLRTMLLGAVALVAPKVPMVQAPVSPKPKSLDYYQRLADATGLTRADAKVASFSYLYGGGKMVLVNYAEMERKVAAAIMKGV